MLRVLEPSVVDFTLIVLGFRDFSIADLLLDVLCEERAVFMLDLEVLCFVFLLYQTRVVWSLDLWVRVFILSEEIVAFLLHMETLHLILTLHETCAVGLIGLQVCLFIPNRDCVVFLPYRQVLHLACPSSRCRFSP